MLKNIYKNQRIYLLYFLLCLGIFFLYGEGKSYFPLWWPRVLCCLFAVLSFFSIYFLGCMVWRFGEIPESALFKLGLGTLVFCSLSLVLGSFGLISQPIALFFLLCLNAFGWREWKRWIEKTSGLAAFWQAMGSLEKFLCIIFFLVFCVNFFHAFLPPLDYDVLEYHLGSPAEYYKAGKVFFMESNVYANFPQNLEMIAFFCMCLAGKLYGSTIAHIILGFYGLALLYAIYCFARKFFSQEEAFLSALLVYFLPWTADLLRIYYVEIPQAFFLILSLVLFEKNNKNFPRQYLLLGIMIGGSAGFKYTSLFLGGLAFCPFFFMIPGSCKDKIHSAGWIAAGFILAFSPWAIRNYVNTGNPLYPLWNAWIVPGYWTEWMYERFVYAHSPRHITPSGLWEKMGDVFFYGRYVSALHLFLFLPSLIWIARKMRALACFLLIWFFLWIGFTHQIDRFIYIILILLCLPMGFILRHCQKAISTIPFACALVIFSLLCLYQQLYLTIPDAYDFFLGLKSREEVLQTHYPPYQAEEFLQKNIQEKVLLLGESRTFHLDIPIEAGTVFDENLLEAMFIQIKDHSKIALSLHKQGILYLYINWNEIARLQSTYSFVFQGKKLPGYLWVSHEEITRFLKNYTNRIFIDPKAKIEIYKLHRQ
ncbi:MAG: glycosyltransferase family 39 protein [Candidatus Brocadiae bacterium]|nr:glycosyltransferase family 39 protein [Candidatus Brocadiia bacterium]